MTAPDSSLEAAEATFREVLGESLARAAVLLADVHPADATEWLRDTDEEDRHRVFGALSAEIQAGILEYADESFTQDLVARLDARHLRAVLEQLPSDEAADVLIEADDRVANDALDRMAPEMAQELRDLLRYQPDSAGGVMATEFVDASVGQRIGDVVKEVRKEGEDAEADLGVFVLDDAGRPIGFLSDRALLTHSIHTPVDEVMVEPFVISVLDDQEIAAQTIAKYGLDSLAVVDADGAMLGVISAEDAADILEDEVSEDFARLTGTGSEGQQTRLPILVRVRQRMPLMGLTVAGGLLSAKVLALALGSASAHGSGAPATGEAILRYIPLIVGLAGNVGIQSSTIFVRGFATGEVDPDREWSVFRTEWCVGAIIGFLCGTATWLTASFLEAATSPGLGVAVGIAVMTAIAWAAFLGGVVPIACRRMGIDPAIVAGPFLIALSDLSGSVIYILVARAIALP
ncbi:Magnesium transporter MgtE [Planctomycetes bacterium Poly30]|uniref:Magnesium transporter MgtE n=1 Tax=Saltatorellus ferox TaxID=2528018 RepID=A0A518ELL6_9BACT|nr:Magnesium transporter MgtE [Planctomycetes bacterium Poly30]